MNALLENAPALPTMLPFVAAPLAMLLPKGRAPWILAVIVSWLTFGACASLLADVWREGPISYHLGGWAPPIGIEYRVDLLNGLVLLLVSGIAAVVFPFAYESVKAEIDARQTSYFYAALLICLSGLLGVAITGDAFNVFVFLEIASLSSYALVAMGARRDRRALTASFNYLVMGTIGATFFVIGLGLLYQATGTLNMADLNLKLAGGDNRVVEAGFAFILVGMGLKLAMFPMHLWLPNAYTFAPSAVSAFLAGTSTKVALYVLVRFFFTVFGADFSFLGNALLFVLLPLGGLAIVLASLTALFQDDVKRLLAYSSVAQIGYMLLGVSLGSVEGVAAALIHLFNHGLMKAALFMAVACAVLRIDRRSVSSFAGLARRMPFTSAAFLAAGASLVGLPLTVGFVSKWYLLKAAFEAGGFAATTAVLIVAGSLIAALYVGRLAEAMVMRAPEPQADAAKEAPLSMLAPMFALVAAVLYFGIDADLTVDVARRAAAVLLGGAAS